MSHQDSVLATWVGVGAPLPHKENALCKINPLLSPSFVYRTQICHPQ